MVVDSLQYTQAFTPFLNHNVQQLNDNLGTPTSIFRVVLDAAAHDSQSRSRHPSPHRALRITTPWQAEWKSIPDSTATLLFSFSYSSNFQSSTMSAPNPYINPSASSYVSNTTPVPQVLAFHKSLPEYNTTTLHSLPDLARSLNVKAVYLKDESRRFGLPAFKILGASWAVYRAINERLGVDIEHNHGGIIGLQELGSMARDEGIQLVTCSEGNWGRAVARMGKLLDIPVTVFIGSETCDEATQKRIASEGAHVPFVTGNYDASIAAAREKASSEENALLVMDTSWEGYETVPKWVVEGYGTMLEEVDQQLGEGLRPTHCFASVGVGSWCQSVVEYYKRSSSNIKVVAVEPDTAACLQTSLVQGKITTITTGDTIMCGMNCGTVSHTAWPVLRDGVDAAVTVADGEAYRDVLWLKEQGVEAGPCGAATVSALRTLCGSGGVSDGYVREMLGLDGESIVVLFSTEGPRPYSTPSA